MLHNTELLRGIWRVLYTLKIGADLHVTRRKRKLFPTQTSALITPDFIPEEVQQQAYEKGDSIRTCLYTAKKYSHALKFAQ